MFEQPIVTEATMRDTLHHMQRILKQCIQILEDGAPAFGGRHPAAPSLLALLDASRSYIIENKL